MKITVFTSNHTRHLSLINSLSAISNEVFAIQESTTVFTGKVDDFYEKSQVMQEYFLNVMAAEKKMFGNIGFLPQNVKQISLKMGDLNHLPLKVIQEALNSDVYVVFGASYIKGELVDFLVKNKCFNIHMGISPFYKGNSTNFWPLYDERPEMVGATIHFLTKGLDSGPMLFHALPSTDNLGPFDLGMKAVKVAQEGLCEKIGSGRIFEMKPELQDKNKVIRYTKRADFTDKVASGYLERLLSPNEIKDKLESRNMGLFYNPYLG
ncbi:formyltransferase family protein [Bacteriovoracales bacterium]|nr:formyltransferase family protein [Bacteriovoracales bacterium]